MISNSAEMEYKQILTESIYTPSYEKMNYERLQEYYEALMANPGESNAPVIVIPVGEKYKLYDGRHRHLASLMAKRAVTPAFIITNKGEF